MAAIVVWAFVLALAVVGPAPLPRSRAGALAVGGLALLDCLERALAAVGAAGRPGDPERAAPRALHRRTAAGDRRAAGAAQRCARSSRRWPPARRSSSATGSPGRLLPGLRRPRSLAQRRRPARAADHLLERRGRARRDRARAVRPARRRPHAPAVRCARSRPPPSRRSAPACTSRTRAARSPSRVLGLVDARRRRADARSSCAPRWSPSPPAPPRPAPPRRSSRRRVAGGRPPDRDGAIVLVLLAVVAAAAGLRDRAPRRAAGRAAAVLAPARRRRGRARRGGRRSGSSSAGLAERPSAAELAARRAGARGSRRSARTATSTGASGSGVRRPPAQRAGRGRLPRRLAQGALDRRGRARRALARVRDGRRARHRRPARVRRSGRRRGDGGAPGAAPAPAAAAGACAGAARWFLHASIDWDWQLPAVTLPAIVLRGALDRDRRSQPRAGPAGRAAPRSARADAARVAVAREHREQTPQATRLSGSRRTTSSSTADAPSIAPRRAW